ncbi:MAG: CpaF family protein [Clostridiaceae bacterium]|nr:CpaF family protein [Clostridiaceae bacterium]
MEQLLHTFLPRSPAMRTPRLNGRGYFLSKYKLSVKTKKPRLEILQNRLFFLVGVTGLEPATSCTPSKMPISISTIIISYIRIIVMRPERIIVGEVRGEEALDMLQAMNTGHDGSMSTGHANSTYDMLSRLETMVLMAAPLPLEAIKKQIASALDIIIFLSRLRDHSRRTMEITEVIGYQKGEIVLNPLFVFEEEGEDENGRVLGTLKRTGNPLVNKLKARLRGVDIE